MVTRAAIYTRISRDDAGDRLGVERQRQDLLREAERRGAEVILDLEDNDLSGSGRVQRPSFDRLLQAIQEREIDLVLAWDIDRLARGLKDFVRFYDATEAAQLKVGWIGGEADFATGNGIFELELRASFAREELRKIKSRIRRKMVELAEHGKPSGGRRAYGFEPGNVVIRPNEAEIIREMARRVLAGESLHSVCRDLNARGVPTTNESARGWRPVQISTMLKTARISGRRERHGEIVATAIWEPIIDVDTSDRLRRLLGDPGRRKNGHATKSLLTGLARCASCDGPLIARPDERGKRRLICATRARRSTSASTAGCPLGVRIMSDGLEALVTEAVLQVVDGGALAKLLSRTDDREAVDALAVIDRKLIELAEDWASGSLSRPEWQTARGALLDRAEALRRRLDAGRVSAGLEGLPDPLRAAWPELPLHRRRAIVSALVEAVTVSPATRRAPGAQQGLVDPERVAITWKA